MAEKIPKILFLWESTLYPVQQNTTFNELHSSCNVKIWKVLDENCWTPSDTIRCCTMHRLGFDCQYTLLALYCCSRSAVLNYTGNLEQAGRSSIFWDSFNHCHLFIYLERFKGPFIYCYYTQHLGWWCYSALVVPSIIKGCLSTSLECCLTYFFWIMSFPLRLCRVVMLSSSPDTLAISLEI